MEVETKYIRSMRLMDSIKQGAGINSERDNIRLLKDLIRNGFIIHRPGRRNWASDSYDLTKKAEKTLDDYDKMGEVIGGSRLSTGHRGR